MSVDEPNRRVSLRVSNKTAYLWSVDDIATLRSQHHVCGILTGTLPHLSQQNVFLGIPLVLLPEEVVLLVENGMSRPLEPQQDLPYVPGVAVLADDPNAHMQPSLSELQSWNDEQKVLFRHQIAANEAKATKRDKSRPLSEEAQKKRNEREERKRLARKLSQEVNTEDMDAFAPAAEISWQEEEMIAKISRSATPEPSISSTNYTITIPAVSEYQWYSSDQVTFSTIAAAREAGVWIYPSNLNERARCGVFRSLWEQGYFMGSGIKFGGDYLVYPGDPLRYHSHFVASVLDSPSQILKPMEIVAHGRLGTATKKSHLLCTWDDEKKEVSCLSIEWAGFG